MGKLDSKVAVITGGSNGLELVADGGATAILTTHQKYRRHTTTSR